MILYYYYYNYYSVLLLLSLLLLVRTMAVSLKFHYVCLGIDARCVIHMHAVGKHFGRVTRTQQYSFVYWNICSMSKRLKYSGLFAPIQWVLPIESHRGLE